MSKSAKADAFDFYDHFSKKTFDSSESKEKGEILRKFYSDMFAYGYDLWSSFYPHAYKSLGMYLGNQWSLSDRERMQKERREIYTVNKIYPLINRIVGHQIETRSGWKVAASSGEGSATADLFTDCLRRIAYKNRFYALFSQSVQGAATTGIDFLKLDVDYSEDCIHGDPRITRCPWNSVLLDPWFSSRDLSDCAYICKSAYLTRDEVIRLNPKQKDMIMSLPAGGADFKFSYLPRRGFADRTDTMIYTEFYRKSTRDGRALIDIKTGECMEWKGGRDQEKMILQMNPNFRFVKKPEQYIEFGIICQDVLLYYGENPHGLGKFPFVPVTAIFEPSYDIFKYRIRSLVSIVEDLQRSLNYKRSKTADILDSCITSGWMLDEGALLNPDSLMQSGQNRILIKKKGTPPDAVRQLSPPVVPDALFKLQELATEEMHDTMGVTREMMGQTDQPDMSGLLYRMKQASGQISLQPFYDGVRDSQEILGRLIVEWVALNWSPDKIRSLTGKEPTPEFYSGAFRKYRVSVEEGLVENNQSNLRELVTLSQMGVPIDPKAMIKASALYDKESALQYAESVLQSQSEQAQAELQDRRLSMQSMAHDMAMEAQKNEAESLRIISEAGSNVAEKEKTLAESQKIRSETSEKTVRALEILAQIDPEKLESSLRILGVLTGALKEENVMLKEIAESEGDALLLRRAPGSGSASHPPRADSSEIGETLPGGPGLQPDGYPAP